MCVQCQCQQVTVSLALNASLYESVGSPAFTVDITDTAFQGSVNVTYGGLIEPTPANQIVRHAVPFETYISVRCTELHRDPSRYVLFIVVLRSCTLGVSCDVLFELTCDSIRPVPSYLQDERDFCAVVPARARAPAESERGLLPTVLSAV